MDRIRILLADGHLALRAQIFARLIRERDFEIVAVADNSDQAVEWARRTRPDIVLIDPPVSDERGLAALREIRAALPNTAIIVLTAYCDTAQRIELNRIGVRHILNKGLESSELVALLRRVGESKMQTEIISEGVIQNA
jgi:DNA-binding NarL/FixJ family response regulator